MAQMNQSLLNDPHIGRLLFKLSLPSFMGMFVMTLYNVIDRVFIGHYVGTLGIAGLSIVQPLQMLGMGMGMLTGMGGASVISRLIGSNNIKRAERALGNALCLNVLLSLIIMAAILIDADFWLRLIGSSESILPYGRDYLTFVIIGMVFQTFSMANNGLITSEGNAKVAMIGMVIGAGSNIVLDAIFIIPLGMGIKGAAIATSIAHLISAIYFLMYWLKGKGYLRLEFQYLKLDLHIIKDIMAIGVSALARTLAGSITAIFINRALVEYGGDFAIATFGILNGIMMFATMPGMVIGHGLQPILGFNFGAGRYHLALKGIRIAMIYATSWCILAFFLLFFVPEPFIRIFSDDPALITMAGDASQKLFAAMPIMGVVFTGSMIFMATGKVKAAFITSITQRALFLVPLVFILPPFWDIDGVWFSFPVSDGLSFVLTLALLVPVLLKFRKLGNHEREVEEANAMKRQFTEAEGVEA
ncbi:MAG: MATE family efflux transporter [Dehalococcoidales bacterium]|nr:MATE family efflux transporter [Dehalococcoidales bacterium]